MSKGSYMSFPLSQLLTWSGLFLAWRSSKVAYKLPMRHSRALGNITPASSLSASCAQARWDTQFSPEGYFSYPEQLTFSSVFSSYGSIFYSKTTPTAAFFTKPSWWLPIYDLSPVAPCNISYHLFTLWPQVDWCPHVICICCFPTRMEASEVPLPLECPSEQLFAAFTGGRWAQDCGKTLRLSFLEGGSHFAF